MVGAVWPASGVPLVVGRASCPFGSENGSVWTVEPPHMGGAATLSRGGGVVGNREGQEAINVSMSVEQPHDLWSGA